MNFSDTYKEILKIRTDIKSLYLPEESGVYGIFLREKIKLPKIHPHNPHRLVYIGETTNLHSRLIKTHFKSGKTGFSTLRRSLGAILKRQLKLIVIPRGKRISQVDYSCYCFTPIGENDLSEWMAKNLLVGFCSIDNNIKGIQNDLIKHYGPELNLASYPNSSKTRIEYMRNTCTLEAHRNKNKYL